MGPYQGWLRKDAKSSTGGSAYEGKFDAASGGSKCARGKYMTVSKLSIRESVTRVVTSLPSSNAMLCSCLQTFGPVQARFVGWEAGDFRNYCILPTNGVFFKFSSISSKTIITYEPEVKRQYRIYTANNEKRKSTNASSGNGLRSHLKSTRCFSIKR